MVFRLIAAALFLIWFVLILLGTSGFVHLLLLTASGITFVEVLYAVRSRVAAD